MRLHNRLQQEMLSHIDSIANDEKIFLEKNFIIRSEALDDIEFHVTDQIQSLAESADSSDRLNDVKQYAEQVRSQLEEVNKKMFDQIRMRISGEHFRGEKLMNLINEYFKHPPDPVIQPYESGYDNFDLFINGLLTYRDLPAQTKEREPGMIYYQKTPARIILELVKKAAFQSGDVFYDLGSGLGQATILVNLLASVISKGVEFEPAYCHYAKACAAELNLSDTQFINEDARHADYSSGDVFFMYTPFEGEMLNDVLSNLYVETKKRKIRIFTYGSCTPVIARQHWLRQVNETKNGMLELAELVSV